MRLLNCLITSISLLLVLPYALCAQAHAKDSTATGSIQGTVKVGGKPRQGIKVVAIQEKGTDEIILAVTLTDEDGRYHLQGIPAGPCIITVDTVSLVKQTKLKTEAEKDNEDIEEMGEDNIQEDGSYASRKEVVLKENEKLTGIELTLTQGGVITGRITDAGGQPIIGGPIHIQPFNKNDQYGSLSVFIYSALGDKRLFHTDDRGIYRVYGLPPGRYQVSVGDKNAEGVKLSWGRLTLPLTYYTGATNEDKPAAVEVTSGNEASNIDIRVTRLRKLETFAITGRVVDGVTGNLLPLVNVKCLQGKSPVRNCYGKSDASGRFRIDGLMQGKYTIEVVTGRENYWYSDQVAFEISKNDVESLEIKAMQTGSITGIVIVENTNDPAALAKLPQFQIATRSSYEGGNVSPNGTFRLEGLQPQNEPVYLQPAGSGGSPFTLLRIERNGILQNDGIQMQAGENITDVRVIVSYYTGKIRGQIKVEGGSLDTISDLRVTIISLRDKQELENLRQQSMQKYMASSYKFHSIFPDKQGKFVLEGLPPGEYEVKVSVIPGSTTDLLKSLKSIGRYPAPVIITNIVTVPLDAEVEFISILNPNNKVENK